MLGNAPEIQPELTILIPMYNEADSLSLLFAQLLPVLEKITTDWEILCINDGSTDATLSGLRHWHEQERRIRILSLSRNFGKEAALSAGLHHANGKAVIPFDADLQDPPQVIPELFAKWREGYKVVLAIRKNRRGDSWLKRHSALLYYKIMRRLQIDLPENSGDFRLLDQQVVAVLRLLPERSRFMKGLFAWVGFSTTSVYYDRPQRAIGKTKQNIFALISLAKDGLFAFSTLPLRITTYLGVIISLVSFSYAFWLIYRTYFFGVITPGYASLMAAILCMGGIQLISLGIIGEYLGRIYKETKQRPLFIIEEIIG